ncbi:hypothetical protein FOL47_006910 [Perkinsus chesapeaki]|uniref:Uncharacterized protein n=1 Tax=Perkinsus chesapeaki TaxID=330153 RepID=A0A7J6LPH2_PERCH|nr:hypothetical protein FOL47_006910 [Perkinsus chesapeaki]
MVETLIFAGIILSVGAVPYGPQGFYCVDDFLTPHGQKLVLEFNQDVSFPALNFSTGTVTLYGLASDKTVVSAVTRFTSSSSASGRSEQLLSMTPLDELERFCQITGLPKAFLSTNGAYKIQSDGGVITDLVSFPQYGSAKETTLNYRGCYESLTNQHFESDGFEFVFGLAANGDITVDRSVTIKQGSKSLGTYEFGFDGVDYPFAIRLVKNRGRYFDKLLSAFEEENPLSKEAYWMEGKALSYDPLNRKITLHK